LQVSSASHKNERGVTILIVAVSLMTLMAMAALAIDVAGLYVARGEAQRAADAAALAGAKMFVTSSYTSNPTGWVTSKLCQSTGPGGTAAVNKMAELTAQSNKIAGSPAEIKSITCDFDTPAHEHTNPQVTVTVQSENVPTFFSKIWSRNSLTVTATATAEAYNASGQNAPIQLTNVKPWLIPNCNPDKTVHAECPGEYFIEDTTGKITPAGAARIGTQIHINRNPTGAVGGNGGTLDINALRYPDSPAPVCPSTSAVSCGAPVGDGDPYIDNTACISRLQFQCGQQIGTGSSPEILIQSESLLALSPTETGTKCLIHATNTGPGQGQDEFVTGVPVFINGGDNNPNTAFHVPNISRSDSVVTVPVYRGDQMCFDAPPPPNIYGKCVAASPTPATVIGFLQLAIQDTEGGGLHAVILNIVGCSPAAIAASPSANAISGGESSPIPVRLVQAR
jgi:hypothetical protein